MVNARAQGHGAHDSAHNILPAPVVIGAQRIEFLEGKHENGLEEGAQPFAPNVAALPRRPASAVSAAAPAAAAAAAYHAAVHFECDSGTAEPGHAPAILANCFEMCALEKRRSGGRRGMQNH